MKEKVENWKKEFAMFVPEDDGTATDWFDNVLSQQKEEIKEELLDKFAMMKHYTGGSSVEPKDLRINFEEAVDIINNIIN